MPENKEQSARPVHAKQWDNTDLWFKKDDRFCKPKGNVAVKIYTHDHSFGTTVKSRVFAEMWKGCLEEYMREFKYMADCAELSLAVTLLHDNVQFHWSGYSDTLPVYVQETFKRVVAMRSANLESIFNQVKEKTLQDMKNFYLNQTFRLAAQYLDYVVLDNSFERKHAKDCLDSFNYEEFAKMHEGWLKTGYMVFFVHGNIAQEAAVALVDDAR